MKPLVLVAALAVIAAPATAQTITATAVDNRMTQAYTHCLDTPSGQTTAGMRDCAAAEYRRQDVELNARYLAVMRQLNTRQQANLRVAQRAWIGYRDARCRSLSDPDWGSLSTVAAADCMATMTVERLIDLENYPPG